MKMKKNKQLIDIWKKRATSLDMLHAREPLWVSTSPQSGWLSLGAHWITDAGDDVERGKSLNTSGESLSYAATVHVSMEVPQKAKNRAII